MTTHEPSEVSPGLCRLSPWADPVTGTPGWQVATSSRRLAVAIARSYSGTARPREKGVWHARIPQPHLTAVVISANAAALWFRLDARPDSGVFTLAFAPWPPAIVLKTPLAELPAHGRLSVRDIRVTTRMGRTVRYLIPEFTIT